MIAVKPQYMAIDQYGQTFHGLTYPRRDLLAKLDRKHADKIYRDGPNDQAIHVGYKIATLWLEVFQVLPWKGAQTRL